MDTKTLEEMIRAEDTHPWYKARLVLVELWGKDLASGAIGLDIGCGSGAAAQLLQRAYQTHPTGMDISEFAVEASNKRGVKTLQVDVTNLPVVEATQDFVLALDVIEHIEDRHILLMEMLRVLKPGGKALITVPAHSWLWSNHDELNHHYRRYSKELLLDDLNAAGFTIKTIRWWNSILLPYLYITRVLTRKKESSEFVLPPKILQFFVTLILTTEARSKFLGKFVGVSIVAAIEKPL